MTNAVKAKPQTTNEYFLAIPHRLLKATGFVSRKTGEKFDLSLTQLAIFQYMKGCYDSYKNIGNPYHESQENIGKACRVSRDTVKKAMSHFEQHGYLIKSRNWAGGIWELPYSLEVVSEEVQEHAERASNVPVEAISSESDTSIAPAQENASKELIEGNSKDIPSVDIEEKPTPAVDQAFKLIINRSAASTAAAAHLQECIPEYDYLGMEINESCPF